MRTLLRAKFVAPMSGPVLSNGGVLFEGETILAVGPANVLAGAVAASEYLGDAVLMPGLINPHTHLELTALGQLPRPASFVDWVIALRERLMREGDPAQTLRQGCIRGVEQCLEFGVTTIGDITGSPQVTRPILAASGLGGTSFGEILGMAGRMEQFGPRLDAAMDGSALAGSNFRAGLEPHAPYSLDLELYRKCVAAARQSGLPLATHLAETADEVRFLADQEGEFRRLWESIGGWTPGATRFAGGPVRAMWEVGLLDGPAILAHVNYADDPELDLLARGRSSVVFCPRTHAYFGHRPHRWRAMLKRGINVAVGTDSAASSPDLNIVEDLRWLGRQETDVPPADLWQLATTRAARALAMEDRVGSLAPGKRADFCAFPVRCDDPLAEILEAPVACLGTWIAGRRMR